VIVHNYQHCQGILTPPCLFIIRIMVHNVADFDGDISHVRMKLASSVLARSIITYTVVHKKQEIT